MDKKLLLQWCKNGRSELHDQSLISFHRIILFLRGSESLTRSFHVSKVVLLRFPGLLAAEKLSFPNPYQSFPILTSLFTLAVASVEMRWLKYSVISRSWKLKSTDERKLS